MVESIGNVISYNDTPSTLQFYFAVKKDANVTKGSFVNVRSKNGIVIGRVTEVYSTNPYVSNPQFALEILGTTEENKNIFPVDEWHSIVAAVEIVGTLKRHENKYILERCVLPPKAGENVFMAEDSIIKHILELDENGLYLGRIVGHEMDARINLSKLLEKHLAILAMSGAGKSYTVSVLMEELLDRNPENGTMSIVIIDPHGEYGVYADDPEYARKVHVIDGRDVRFSVSENLTPSLIGMLLPSLSTKLRDLIGSIIREVLEDARERGPVNLEYIKRHVNNAENIKDSDKTVLVRVLEELESMAIFDATTRPTLKNMKLGHAYIYDLSTLTSMKRRQVIVRLLAQNLLLERQRESIPPTLLVIEEAHNFVPSKESKYEALAREIIEKIAREGRKFFLPLCLVSQRPFYLSPTALSQCNTQIIMRVTNPYDLDHIKRSSEGLSREIANSITTLREGECVIVGEAARIPVFVKIRERRCKQKSRHINLEDASKSWIMREIKKKADINTFL